ncbi:kelch domain-containing protein 3, partial [Bonamia ostreae]
MKIRTKQKNYSTPRKRDEKGKVARRVKSIEKGKFEPDEIADKIADQIADKISSRNVTAQHINQFLPKRPSSDVLIKNHLVQNTMTWNAETVSGKPPSARNCHSATVIGKKMFLTGGYGDHSNKETFIELIDLDLRSFFPL